MDEKSHNILSYKLHRDHLRKYATGREHGEHARKWLDKTTVDAWRHARFSSMLDPLLDAAPGASWLTIGDGRYGLDSKYINDRGGKALATDISDALLAEAKELGIIKDYRVENAEELTFENNSFDYVCCKQSYHHFPRPPAALYEMIRVCKKAVVLMEPNDPFIHATFRNMLYYRLKTALKKLLGKPIKPHAYETVGNYLFFITRREMEKISCAMNFKHLAFGGLNDVYTEGVESQQAEKGNKVFKKLKLKIGIYNLLSKLGFHPYNLLVVVIFKEPPDNKMIASLSRRGFDNVELPDNPYLPGR